MTEIWLALIAGLAGSPHCIGMCGAVVAAIAMTQRNGTPRARVISQLLYNLGRISTYTLLGIIAGFIGSTFDFFAVRSVSLWVFCASYVLVIVIGLASAFGLSRFNLTALENSSGKFLSRPVGKLLSAGSTTFAAFPLGVLLGFLPCGLVYAPLLVAAGSHSALRGGTIMAALGLGTMPVMLLFGSASTFISMSIRNLLFRIVGMVIALMGVAGLWRLLAKMELLTPFLF